MLLCIGEAQLYDESLFLPGGLLKLGCKNAIMFCTVHFSIIDMNKIDSAMDFGFCCTIFKAN